MLLVLGYTLEALRLTLGRREDWRKRDMGSLKVCGSLLLAGIRIK